MTPARHVEEHANTLLAQILRGLGINVKAETTGHAGGRRPDFSIHSGGWSVIMEAEYDSRRGAEKDADARLKQDPPRVIGAISYSPPFREDFSAAVKNNARLDFAFKRAEDGAGGWEGRWRTGTVYDLAQILRSPDASAGMPYERINFTVARVANALKEFAAGFCDAPGKQERIVKLLQASLPVAGKKREKAVEHSLQLAGLILVGAFLFQFALSAKSRKVKNPRDFEEDSATVYDIEQHWRFILKEINYAAIFQIAAALLKQGGVKKHSAIRLMLTARDVEDVFSEGADVMGVLYHEMLAELAKPLGAYYTTIPAAAMLSALALEPQKWDVEWEKPRQVSDFRIADFACGSGTLLAAACGQVRDNVMRAHSVKILRDKKILIDGAEILEETQRTLLENSIWGYDVLDVAVHLTATTLGLMAPEVDFRKSRIYRAVVGKHEIGDGLTGSLQLLEEDQVSRVLFSEFNKEARVAHAETGEEKSAQQSEVDLCIMNPPFVVGRKNALSYSFLPPEDMEAVRFKMKHLARRNNFSIAGLGPAFVALGEKYIKEGGRMAFILSTTIATGRNAAWAGARQRIEKTCDLEFFIISRAPGHSNFSSGTNLQECMFVARKRKKDEKPKERAVFAVLSENPQDGNQAHATARAVLDAEKNGKEWGKLIVGGREVGEFARLRYRGKGTWDGIAYKNLRLTAAADLLADKGRLTPYSKGKLSIPMRPLSELAYFGSHHLHCRIDTPEIEEDIPRHLAFSKTPTDYAGYYPGHLKRTKKIRQMDIKHIQESPNCYFLPLEGQEKKTEKYFEKKGRIIINGSFRFNTSRRLASLISAPVQGANYQPVQLNKDTDGRAKALVLWLNSTPGTLLIASYAVYCEGAKVMFSQKAAADMPVLDLDALSAKQIKSLARAFDKIAEMEFMPIPQMPEDPARIAIDDALAAALELKDFDFAGLRAALAVEPIITGK